mmetsp:Transcript_4126/g.5066  ORF Transcript_4126/g.5066 Transcript_4126/m.5066 type:complete len:217 (+) Transcript_4126:984-1634(+)|eukprot:CAMPEP_0184033852 /NCGR_PEP_ID=MMETSP0955-20130417/4069_1 /TAXON_ID=627963 /ORGANISM="Aplanochytrium sp, Strain PBS07" /LENGTH=216 /DNA_ID=CAMNT_0026320365 /DNA_START=85 /DNA_END=735 /DNA_ORIENTATION=+
MAAATFRKPVILCICGSQKVGSVNKKLLNAAEETLKRVGADTLQLPEPIDLPLFSEKTEAENRPPSVKEVKSYFDKADAFCIASPEYNGSMTPYILNLLTWMSRPIDSNDNMYSSFTGKHALVMAASPGALGGLRSLVPMQDLLLNMGTTVLPQKLAVGGAFKAFDEHGMLVNERQKGMLENACHSLMKVARTKANEEEICKAVAKYADYGNLPLN